MADPFRIKSSLATAAGKLRRRPLSTTEQDQLFSDYQQRTGTTQDRMTKSLGKATNLSAEDIQRIRAADDDCDRTLRDLENILKQ